MDSSLDKKILGFNKISQEKLQNIFCCIPGKKDLIIETFLIKPLEHVCGAQWLRAKGVEKIYKFDQKNPPPKNDLQMVYFISSNLLLFKHVLDQIQSYDIDEQQIENDLKTFHVILFPSVLYSFQHLLEEEGLCGIVSLHRFQWDFLTIDNGVLSLEIPQIFRDIYIKQDLSMLCSIANSLRLWNIVMKKPKIILTYGDNSDKLIDMVNKMEQHRPSYYQQQQIKDNDNEHNSDFNAMIVMDRNKDFTSSLLTPVIYAGFLSELFQMKTGTFNADPNLNRIKLGRLDYLEINSINNNNIHDKQSASTSDDKKDIGNIKMNSSIDSVYNEHKYLHFTEVLSHLSAQAKLLGDEKIQTKTMKIDEMKEYVKNKLHKVATQKRELFKHLILCETIMKELGGNYEKIHDIEENMLNNHNRKQILNSIDELLSIDAHKYNIIRLMCLFHITIGLTIDESQTFIRNYCNTFGYKYLNIFANLYKLKLFPDTINVEKTNLLSTINITNLPKWQTQFQIDSNKLKLIPIINDDIKTKTNPTCPSYVFNGIYIPLIGQLSNILLKAENFDEIFTKLGHLEQIKISGKSFNFDKPKTIKEIQQLIKRTEIYVNELFPLRPRTLFIFIVGGLTYAEIAACNLIEKFTGSKIVISSNCIISGTNLIESAFFN